MENNRLVVLFGDSLLMDGVEASLRASESLSVMRILDMGVDLSEHLHSLQPDVVLFDWDTPQAQLIVSVLRDQPGVTLLGLDVHSRKVIIVSSHQYTPLSASELVQVIQSQPFHKVRGIDPNSIMLGEWKAEFLH
jgi:DNA-binding NarL/FixJ family response regulator